MSECMQDGASCQCHKVNRPGPAELMSHVSARRQGCVKCSATGNFLLTEKLGEVRGMMEAYGVKPDRRTFALQIEACLKEQELEVRALVAMNPDCWKPMSYRDQLHRC